MLIATSLLAATITAQPLVDPDVLEPSVQNEVDHALSLAPSNAFECVSFPTNCAAFCHAATNGLSATDIAIKLVSSQKPDGRWMDGTNDVTSAVLRTLRELSR